MFLTLLVICLMSKAWASDISGYGNKTAEYGDVAHYRCAVTNLTGVLQVTWQRLFKNNSIENLAAYSTRFGQQVNEPYQGKVNFTEASLSSSSITVRNVTWDDESCYICSFNAFPGGSIRKQICLTVQGILKVNTASHIVSTGDGKEDNEVVFSCSATGKPVPTIEWEVSDGATPADQPQAVTVANSDHTFTSSRNITVKVSPGWHGHVDCLLKSGLVEKRKRIPLALTKNGLSSSSRITLITVAVITSCIILTVVVRQRLKKKKEENQTIV